MIPKKYTDAEYKDVPEQIKEIFKKSLKSEEGRGFYLHGESGTGKTHIAYALFKKYNEINTMSRAIFWNVAELLQEIRLDFDKPNIEKSRPEERLMNNEDILFLDDIGAENMTDWVAERFYLMIDNRYKKNLPTFFTSNLTVGGLKEKLGIKLGTLIASRMVEMCEIVELTGPDRRWEKLKKTKVSL